MARLARLFWIWLVIFALAGAAAWLADNPGEVSLIWLGYRADTSVAVLFLLLATAAFILVWFDRLRRLTVRRMEAISHFTERLRTRRAQDALVRGLVAAASGDAEGAKRHLATAEKGSADPRLLLLLRAQSARLAGDRLAAEDAFTAMLDSADTEGLGLSGLMAEARARGDDDRLRELTARAHGMALQARGLFEAAFEGEVLAGRWPQARKLVTGALRHGVIGREAASRLRTVLLTAEGRDLRSRGEAGRALKPLGRALELDPGFTPAALLAAEIQKSRGRRKRAARIIETAWRSSPHPELGRLYAELSGNSEPSALLSRLRTLADLKAADPESRLLVAQLAVHSGRVSVAEDALAPLLTPEPSARVCNVMADAAKAAHGRAAGQSVEAWLTHAARAPRDGFWRCTSCGREAAAWEPMCTRCRTFDGLRWVTGVEGGEPAAEPHASPAGPQAGARTADAYPPGISADAPGDRAAAEAANGAARAGAGARNPRPAGPVDPAIHLPPRPPDDPGPDSDDERVNW